MACELGAKDCRADGLYACDATGAFQLAEACTSCEDAPIPHCAVSCGDAGVTSICEGGSVKDCATGTTRSCETGTCLPVGQAAVCATKPGDAACQGRRADGTTYLLACADANGIATDEACDRRTGRCVPAAFDCAALAGVPANQYTCDATTHDYVSACGAAGQPSVLACADGQLCANDGETNCYTPPTAGTACGGPTVCYPGLHCTQTAASGATCVQPAAQLACNATDVLAVCTDIDTGVACVNGSVWWWKNLTTWGGSCAGNHVVVPEGGNCIPGLADCKIGLECQRSRFDIAGVCKPPAPSAPADCVLTGQLSLGTSCIYDWHACRDGRYYDIDCRRVNVGGVVVTLCECSVDGTVTKSFGGAAVCQVTDTAMLDAKAMMECAWTVRTTEVSP